MRSAKKRDHKKRQVRCWKCDQSPKIKKGLGGTPRIILPKSNVRVVRGQMKCMGCGAYHQFYKMGRPKMVAGVLDCRLRDVNAQRAY